MEFEWDADKATSNLRKHGIDFADVVAVFEDDFALSRMDEFEGEERHVVMGSDVLGRVVVVIYTFRGDAIRLISARRANRRERRQYESKR